MQQVKYSREFLENYIKEQAEGRTSPLKSRDIDANIARVIMRRYGWNEFLYEVGVRSTKASDTVIKEGIRLYTQEGLSMRQIGERLGFTKHAVQEWMRLAGVKTRTVKDYDIVNWDRKPTRIFSRGYIILAFPGGKRILEHRYVMEQYLGRSLAPGEIVHHLNAIRTDNRPENLFVTTRPEHDTSAEESYKKHYIARIRDLERQVEELTHKLESCCK